MPLDSEVKVFEYEPGKHCLSFIDTSEVTFRVFDEHSLQGGGYTWEGVLRSLLKLRMSDESLVDLDIGAEADNLYIYSRNRLLLERIKKLIDEAVADPDLLSTAIENAGEGLE